jgi:hypothetical protein
LRIKNPGCGYWTVLQKQGDNLFSGIFNSDWNWIMEVKKKICNLTLIDEFKSSYDSVVKGWRCIIIPRYKNLFDYSYSQVFENELEAHISVINKFIDWYNKQKEK